MQRIPVLILLCLLVCSVSLRAQEFPKRTFRVQLSAPLFPALNVHLENRLASNISLVARAEAITILNWSGYYGFEGFTAIVPSAELRWYYNARRRINLGKSIKRFSGNFFAAEPFVTVAQFNYGTPFGLPSRYPRHGVFLNYGMQRGFGNHGHFGFTVGCAPTAVFDDYTQVIAKLNFHIGLQW